MHRLVSTYISCRCQDWHCVDRRFCFGMTYFQQRHRTYLSNPPPSSHLSRSGVLFVVCICLPWQYHLDLDLRVARRLMN
ncbi:hypothetical protein GE21DRAFT_1026077 [Neurospora crassa]|nr:hypothetical protein GE21DRAFT_1026077 [Neurospora crassa]